MSQPQPPKEPLYRNFANAVQVVIDALNASDLIESVEEVARGDAYAEFTLIGKLTPDSEIKFMLNFFID